jgi:hypothetical protein
MQGSFITRIIPSVWMRANENHSASPTGARKGKGESNKKQKTGQQILVQFQKPLI